MRETKWLAKRRENKLVTFTSHNIVKIRLNSIPSFRSMEEEFLKQPDLHLHFYVVQDSIIVSYVSEYMRVSEL